MSSANDSDFRFCLATTVIPVVMYGSVSTGGADGVKNPSFLCLSPSLTHPLAAMFSFGQLPFLLFSGESASPILSHVPLFFCIQQKLFFRMVVLGNPGVWCR